MIVERLARGELVPLLDHINVVAVPRANPDGAEAFRRTTANRIDLNRDHLLARTPEAPVLIALIPRPGTTSSVARNQSRRFDLARDPARRPSAATW